MTRLTQEVDVSMEKNEALKKVMEERLCEKDAAYQEMMKQFKSTMDGNIDKMSQEKVRWILYFVILVHNW